MPKVDLDQKLLTVDDTAMRWSRSGKDGDDEDLTVRRVLVMALTQPLPSQQPGDESQLLDRFDLLQKLKAAEGNGKLVSFDRAEVKKLRAWVAEAWNSVLVSGQMRRLLEDDSGESS